MLHLGKKDLLMKWKGTLISALEIAIIMYLGVIIISTYFLQSQKYQPYSEMFKSEGVRTYQETWLGSSYTDHEGLDQIVSSLDKVKNVHYTLWDSVYLYGLSNMKFEIIGYDETMADYNPDMKEGVWYTDYVGDEPLVAVITENTYGLGLGEYIDIFSYDENGEPQGPVTAYVCGILRNGEEYIYGNMFMSHGSMLDYYTVYDAEKNAIDLDNPIIFMSLEDMERNRIGIIDCGFFIQYEDDITKEEVTSNEDILTDTGVINTFEQLREGSLDEIMKKLMVIIPIAFGALFFVTISIACNSAIDTNKTLKDYAIYYICGMKWSGIIVMRLINGITTGVLAGMIMYIISQLIARTSFGKDIVFEMGQYQWMCCLAIILYSIIISLFIPVIIINKNKPVSILKEAEV